MEMLVGSPRKRLRRRGVDSAEPGSRSERIGGIANAFLRTLPVPMPMPATAAPVKRFEERRRTLRRAVMPMYSHAVVRAGMSRSLAIEGYVLNLSETGVALEIDTLVDVGTEVTLELQVSCLGKIVDGEWAHATAEARLLRQDELHDFPGGPYRVGLRFTSLPAELKEAIGRYLKGK